jgi:DNA-binding MarR family transcriptional regulator
VPEHGLLPAPQGSARIASWRAPRQPQGRHAKLSNVRLPHPISRRPACAPADPGILTTSFHIRKLVVIARTAMNPTKADKLTRIALAVFRLNGQLIEWGDHVSQPQGLTSARWQVLGAIEMAPQPPNIPQIATAMGITRQAVLKQIKLLADEALIQALPNPAHKRSRLYSLTSRGRTAYQALLERWQKHVHDMAAEFGVADLDAAIGVLSVLSRLHEPGPKK